MTGSTRTLVKRWKADRDGTYQTWFLWPKYLKNFRSIRCGIGTVANEIQTRTFGGAYRGFPLETMVPSIAEQRQIFKEMDHAFLWEPKLYIPGIYENAGHQRAFARLLYMCNCCDAGQELVQVIQQLNQHGTKGLDPVVASLLYLVHPTLAAPFNTVIVSGYNILTGSHAKPGKWDYYPTMYEGVLPLNGRRRDLLSNDLGVVAELLFDIGMERYLAPP